MPKICHAPEDDRDSSISKGVPLPHSKRHEKFIPNPKLKLLEQCSEVFRFYHYSLRTEHTYIDWIRRFILFHGKRHPREMGAPELTGFLSHLATHLKVAPATQAQALNAIVFLYRDVLLSGFGVHWTRFSGDPPGERVTRG